MRQNPFRDFLRSSSNRCYFPRTPGLGFGLVVILVLIIGGLIVPSLPIERTVAVKVELRRQQMSSKTRSLYSSSVSRVWVHNFDRVQKGDLLYTLKAETDERELKVLAEKIYRSRIRLRAIEQLIGFLNSGEFPVFEVPSALEFESIVRAVQAQELFFGQRIQTLEKEYVLLLELPTALQSRNDLELKPLEILNLRQDFRQWKLGVESDWNQEWGFLKSNLADLELQAQLILHEIENYSARAPIDGQVTFLRELQVGDFLTQGEAVLEISPIGLAQRFLSIKISPKDITRVHLGMPIRVQFYSLLPRDWGFGVGTITAISSNPMITPDKNQVYLAEGELYEWTGDFQTDRFLLTLPEELSGEGTIVYETATLGDFVLDLLQFGYLFSNSGEQ